MSKKNKGKKDRNRKPGRFSKEAFSETIFRGNKNEIVKTSEFPLTFQDPHVSINFLSSLALAGSHAKGKQEKLINNLFWIAKERFSRLPPEKMLPLITCYYKRYQEYLEAAQNKNGKKQLQIFCLAHTLFGSNLGEKDFSKRVFKKLISLFEIYCFPEEGDKEKSYIKSCLLNLLAGIIALTGRTHTWENFLADLDTNPRTQNMFKTILFIFLESSLLANNFRLLTNSKWNQEKDPSLGLFGNCLVAINYDGPIKLPILDDHVLLARMLKNDLITKMREQQEDIVRLTTWFKKNLTFFLRDFEHMWSDLLAPKKKYGIRKGGLDQFEVGIKELENAGYTKASLIKEGFDFPEIKARFYLKMCGSTFQMDYPIKVSKLNSEKLNDFDENLKLINMVLTYIAMKSYWQIVTGCNYQSEKNGGEGKGKNGSRTTSWVVRPFFRPLPNGQRPSKRALALAEEEFGEKPPPGYTFVSQYECFPQNISQREKALPKPSVVLTIKKEDITPQNLTAD